MDVPRNLLSILPSAYQMQHHNAAVGSDAYDAAEICGVGRRHYVAADELLCFLWFHTGFEQVVQDSEPVCFSKADIDVACHDDKCKVLRLESPAPDASSALAAFEAVVVKDPFGALRRDVL